MLLLINYCSDMFQPQFFVILRELISLCSLHVKSPYKLHKLMTSLHMAKNWDWNIQSNN
jgi:hypothetical protein